MSQRRGGIIFLAINGVSQDVKGQARYKISGRVRTPVVGQDGVHGHSEKPDAPELELMLTDAGSLDLKALALIENATIVLQLANGKVVTFSQAWATADWQVDSGEGEVSAKFNAVSAQESSA